MTHSVVRFVMLMLLVVTTPFVAVAQYSVKDGDTLWGLAGKNLDSPKAWESVYNANPFLREPGRRFVDGEGRTIVVLHSGEILAGLNSIGIVPAVVPAGSTLVVTEVRTPPGGEKASTAWDQGAKWFFWVVILALVAAFLLFELMQWRRQRRQRELSAAAAERDREAARAVTAARERELTRDPVTSGPPIVAGGIAYTEVDRLANHFQDRAVAQYVLATPGTDATLARPNIVRVGAIEVGTISGEGLVGYADRVRPRRINPPQAGYRARFRFPDGSEQELMSLLACMNPCMYGEGMTGFTFTTRAVAVPVPEAPQPAPQAVPHPALAVRAIRTAAQAAGETTVTIGDRVLVFEKGVHLTVDEATGAVSMEGSSFKMVLQPKKSVSEEHPRATGSE